MTYFTSAAFCNQCPRSRPPCSVPSLPLCLHGHLLKQAPRSPPPKRNVPLFERYSPVVPFCLLLHTPCTCLTVIDRKDGDYNKAKPKSALEPVHGMASPKRALSLSRDGASVSLLAKGEREAVHTGTKQGAKPTEVYGFVGAISTLVAFVVFVSWAYLPEPWLHTVGITYYPSRYWAMAIPAYLMVAIFFVVAFYTSLNYIATPPPYLLSTLFDEYTRPPMKVVCVSPSLHKEDQPIHAISDIPITTVNALLFGPKVR